MKWDIDKALERLRADDVQVPNTTLHSILVDGGRLQGSLSNHGLKPRKDKFIVRCLGFGRMGGPMLHFYGWTIREAYLNARKALRNLPANELAHYGIRTPKKRSNSYASARKKPRK